MAVTMTSRAGESVSVDIPFHKHCQKTILAASGIPSGNGATWSTISDLSEKLNYFPENWLEKYFMSNHNITEDLASILELINGVYGKISEISPIKQVSFYDAYDNIIGTYVPDKNGQISPKLGKKINLSIEGEQISFSTLTGAGYDVSSEITSITLPKHTLSFTRGGSTLGTARVVMDDDTSIPIPHESITVENTYPNGSTISRITVGNTTKEIKTPNVIVNSYTNDSTIKYRIADVKVGDETKDIYTIPGFFGIGTDSKFFLFGTNSTCGYTPESSHSDQKSSTDTGNDNYCLYYCIGQTGDKYNHFNKTQWDNTNGTFEGAANDTSVQPIVIHENGFLYIDTDSNTIDEHGQVYVHYKKTDGDWQKIYRRDIGKSGEKITELIPVCKGTELWVCAIAMAGQCLPFIFQARFVSLSHSWDWVGSNTGTEIGDEEDVSVTNMGDDSGQGSEGSWTGGNPSQPTTSLTLNEIYPIGSVYLSINPNMPNSLTTGMVWEGISSSINDVYLFKRVS